MKVKAAVQYEYFKPLVIEEVELDPMGPDEVLLKLAACAICHSDVHCQRAEHGTAPLPGIGGHEMSGWVEAVGENVTYVKPGDLVAASIMPTGCGHCYYCYMGIPGKCLERPIQLFIPSRFVNKDGKRLTAFEGEVAGFAEYTVVPEANLVKVPADFRPELAALIACGVISGFGAVLNRAKVPPNKSVTVFGCGGVGLNAIQGARFVGAHPIIAVDILDSKLETAKQFGATHTINARKEADVVAKVKEITYDRGSDYCIAASMGAELLRQAWDASAVQGTTVVIGHGFEETLEAWHPIEFCLGRTITGSAMGAVQLRVDIPRIIELYQFGRIKLDEMIGSFYSFDQIQEAIDDMAKGNVIRNVIMFDR
ncbi:MAG: alcohol dehydrogenase catalytic domain-containing protein [Thermoleophilia bacterium]|nr:alcohol dehydrogenase catalytic domain-containing protein [Thermoleophilia bacterium]